MTLLAALAWAILLPLTLTLSALVVTYASVAVEDVIRRVLRP